MTNQLKFVHSADKLAEMRTKFHIIQAKLVMSVWCFTVHWWRLGAGGHLGEVAEVHQRGAPHRVRAARADPGHPQQHRPLQGRPRVPGTRGCCHDVALLNWISLYSNLKESRTSMAMDHVNLYQIYLLWQWSRRLCVSCWVSSVTLNTDYSNSV